MKEILFWFRYKCTDIYSVTRILNIFRIYEFWNGRNGGEFFRNFLVNSYVEKREKRGGNRTKFSLSECQQVANRENWRESRARNSVVQFCTACLVYSILCSVRFKDTTISLIFAKIGVSLWNEMRGWDWARLSVKGKNIVKKKKEKKYSKPWELIYRVVLSSHPIDTN